MTNAEKYKELETKKVAKMTNEEIAEIMDKDIKYCKDCPCENSCTMDKTCKEYYLDWLDKEAEKETFGNLKRGDKFVFYCFGMKSQPYMKISNVILEDPLINKVLGEQRYNAVSVETGWLRRFDDNEEVEKIND